MTDMLKEYESATPKDYWNIGGGAKKAVAHYTTFSGALGIIKSKKLWATNIHYLNDYSEFNNGINMSIDEMKRRSKNANKFERNLLYACIDRIERISKISIYVASFCEDNNILSQWRGYAGGSGVSMLFSYERLQNIAYEQGFRLVKCVYSDDHKRQIISNIIDKCMDMQSGFRDEAAALESAVAHIHTFFITYFPAFKDTAFSEEQEWRLVSQPTSCLDAGVGFRTTATMLIPHFEINLDCNQIIEHDKTDIGLRAIMVGPNTNRELALDAITMLLHKENIFWSHIDRSAAPYRPNI